MLLVAIMAGAIWGIGYATGMPRVARWYMIGLLYVAVLAGHVVLPDGHPLRAATGDSAAPWLVVGVLAAAVYAYSLVLARVRAQAAAREKAATPPADPGKFGEGELERYARHIVLRELGGPGQKRLRTARVLVVGAGGLGSPALLYLAAAGVGTIGVIDHDVVDSANLQRQVIHRDAGIGMPKVFSAEAAMKALNPYIVVRPYNRRLTEDIASDLIDDYDLILDGTDSFDTRALVNRATVAQGKPLVSGALAQWEGQITVYDPAHGAPCYACLFPEKPAPGLAPSCAEAGVLGPLPGVIGAMMAVEAVKVISGAGTPLRGAMLIYDALEGETRRLKATRRPDCPVCGSV
jgi:molybdopterin/thiamine biosynthesis adenylyltransferase